MHAQLSALFVVHHALKHRAEDVGVDFLPALGAQLDELLPGLGGKSGDDRVARQRVAEQPAIHIREAGEVRQRFPPHPGRGVEGEEELLKEGIEIRAVARGALTRILMSSAWAQLTMPKYSRHPRHHP